MNKSKEILEKSESVLRGAIRIGTLKMIGFMKEMSAGFLWNI